MRRCASGRAATVLLAGALLTVVWTVFSCGGLSAKERQQLDALDPAGVVRTFVEGKDVQALVPGRPRVQLGVPWQVGPLNDLVITGPYDADIRSSPALPALPGHCSNSSSPNSTAVIKRCHSTCGFMWVGG